MGRVPPCPERHGGDSRWKAVTTNYFVIIVAYIGDYQ
jgi:hypothetical protein